MVRFSPAAAIAILLIMAVSWPYDGYSRELTLIFEARAGQPLDSQYVAPGLEPPVWNTNSTRILLAPDGSIIFPRGDRAVKLSRDGRYQGETHFILPHPEHIMGVRLMSVDAQGRFWCYFPWYLMSYEPPVDYRNHLIAFNPDGSIERDIKLNISTSPRVQSWTGDALPDGNFHIHPAGQRSYIIDTLGQIKGIARSQTYDALGGSYHWDSKWIDSLQGLLPQSFVKPSDWIECDDKPNGEPIPALDSLMFSLLRQGITPFTTNAGCNRSGYMAWEISGSPPDGYLNNPWFEIILYDAKSRTVVERARYDWNTPPETTPCILFNRLEEDNGILIGLEVPTSPWKVHSTPGGGMPVVTPGPGGCVFRLYRFQ